MKYLTYICVILITHLMNSAKTLTDEQENKVTWIPISLRILPEQKEWLEAQRAITGEDMMHVIRRLLNDAMKEQQVAKTAA